jgi:hypothetical protein
VSVPTSRLYELLPAVYRIQDAERRRQLLALLQVIEQQVDVVEHDIDRLYDNWFIETCDDWVVPYIADLIGYRPVAAAGPPTEAATAEGRALNRALIPRREVANTIRYRRRKGALALLEDLARDVAGWPAHAVEFYRLLAVEQALNHLRLERGRLADLRDADALDRLGGPFDELAHTVDMRRPSSLGTRGRFNIPSVGLFVWRLRSYSISHAPAYQQQGIAPNAFSFSALGHDQPLFIRPDPGADPSSDPEVRVPARIRRHPLRERPADYVGAERSFAIWVNAGQRLISPDRIDVTDLDSWTYRPARGRVAVDPLRGRIAFHPREIPKNVSVSYRHGFSDDLGGGEYERPLRQRAGSKIYRVGRGQKHRNLMAALNRWQRDKPKDAVIEIADSNVYTDELTIKLDEDRGLQLRAAAGSRPVIRLLDRQTDRPDSLTVLGDSGSRFVLDGIIVTGQAVAVEGDLAEVTIRHSTLVPGWGLECDCEPKRPNEPSLVLVNTQACVSIERSIIGSIQVLEDEVGMDPVPISIADSIVDATSAGCEAVAGPPDWPLAHAILTVRRSTIFGGVHVHAIDLAENSIFGGFVRVARRQRGCMRYCWVEPSDHTRTPRRYHCQPDLVVKAAPDERAAEEEIERTRPEFTSVRYGTPGYCQLTETCASEIMRGAEDESELGVFHDLFQPQRAENLRARLREYSPAGMDAGVIYAS